LANPSSSSSSPCNLSLFSAFLPILTHPHGLKALLGTVPSPFWRFLDLYINLVSFEDLPQATSFTICYAEDVDRRIRQHNTSCPSGHWVYSVPISCKAMEKLFESTMKQHGAWIKMEEYELSLSDTQIKALFDCFARVEELLNVTPLDEYSNLVGLFDHSLGSRTVPSSELISGLPQDHVHAAEEDGTEGIDIIALFEKLYIARGTKDDHFKLKEAEAKWPQFVGAVEDLHLGLTPMDMIKPDKEELRQLLQSRLLTPCPKDSRLIGGSTQKSAFRGWKLLDHARPLQ